MEVKGRSILVKRQRRNHEVDEGAEESPGQKEEEDGEEEDEDVYIYIRLSQLMTSPLCGGQCYHHVWSRSGLQI